MEDKKKKRKKAFEGFGTMIGGGTKEDPTIKPTQETSIAMRKKRGRKKG